MFLLGASDSYPAETTGGNSEHIQTESEVATHSHKEYLWMSGYGSWSETGYDYHEDGYCFNWSNAVKNWNAGTDIQPAKKCLFCSTTTIGESEPMNILNPYYAVYIWRRIQ